VNPDDRKQLEGVFATVEAMAAAAVEVLEMLPSYGVYNERGMVELRQAVCAWYGAPCGLEGGAWDPTDARGFSAHIRPHMADERLR